MIPLVAALVVAIGSGAPATASSLRWSAPDECPAHAAVEERVELLVGGPPATTEAVLDARVTRLPERRGYALDMRMGTGATAQQRTVTADTCEALADVAALVVAVSTEPVATADRVALDTMTPAIAEPVATSVPERPVSTRRMPARASTPSPPRSRVQIGLRPRVAASIGATPGVTAGGDIGVLVGGSRVHGELVASHWLRRSTGADAPAVRVSLSAISPRVCGALPQPRVGVVACLGPELGIMRGDGNGTTRRPAWIALALEMGARIRLRGRLALWASAGVAAPLRFPVFRVRDGGGTTELFRPAVATGRVLVGLEIGLGRQPGKSP